MIIKVVSFNIILFINVSIYAQSFPVTSTSEEAKKVFLDYGWDNAFRFHQELHIETMDKLIAMDSTFALAYLHRGGYAPLHIRKEYFELAKQNKKHITEDERKLVDAFYAFMWDMDQHKAIKILQELANKYPKQPHFPAYIGIRYWNLGEYEKAIPFFKEALQKDPDFTPAYQLIGTIHLRLKNYDKARENFLKYIEKDPNSFLGYRGLGLVNLEEKKLVEADEMFQTAISMDSTSQMRDDIGYYYLTRGFTERAEQLFKENLELHPDDPNTYAAMGDFYSEKQEFAKAAKWYAEALKYNPLPVRSRNYYDNMIESWIRHVNQLLTADFETQDLNKLMNHFTISSRIIDQTGIYSGKESVQDYWQSRVDDGIDEIVLSTGSVRGSHDKFYATETGKFAMKNNGESVVEGSYVAIWRNNSDGWKIDNVMYVIQSDK